MEERKKTYQLQIERLKHKNNVYNVQFQQLANEHETLLTDVFSSI